MSQPTGYPSGNPEPSTIPRCPDCGGQRVGGLAPRPHAWHQLSLTTADNSKRVTTLQAVVCLQCGHVKLYTSDLEKLRQLTSEHPERFRW